MQKRISLFLHIFFFVSSLPAIAKNPKRIVVNAALSKIVHKLQAKSVHSEGFLAGTLIKTPAGHISIENLQVGDSIDGIDDQGNVHVQKVTAISKRRSSSYIKIIVGNEAIYAAPRQKFRIAQSKGWVCAKDLRPFDTLLDNGGHNIAIDQITTINQFVNVYLLTTEDQIFYATTRNIYTHNFAELITGPVAILMTDAPILAPIVTTNPVAAVIGAMAYVFVGSKFFKMLKGAIAGRQCKCKKHLNAFDQDKQQKNSPPPPSKESKKKKKNATSSSKGQAKNSTPSPTPPKKPKKDKKSDKSDKPKKSTDKDPRLTEITDKKMAESIDYCCDKNNLVHWFRKNKIRHKFDKLLEKMGEDEIVLVKKILKACIGKVPANGIFKDIPVVVEGFTVYVHGCVINGVIKIGTMFIK